MTFDNDVNVTRGEQSTRHDGSTIRVAAPRLGHQPRSGSRGFRPWLLRAAAPRLSHSDRTPGANVSPTPPGREATGGTFPRKACPRPVQRHLTEFSIRPFIRSRNLKGVTSLDPAGEGSRVLVLAPEGPPLARGAANERPRGAWGIRAWRITESLRGEFDVTLAAPEPDFRPSEGPLRLISHTLGWSTTPDLVEAARFARDYDVVIFHDLREQTLEALSAGNAVLMLDGHAPLLLEGAARAAHDDSPESAGRLRALSAYRRANVMRADYIIHSSDRQRDYYLGLWAGLGQLTAEQPNLDRFLIPAAPAIPPGQSADALSRTDERAGERPIRGRLARDQDFVLLWFGAVYPWYDLENVLRAVALLRTRISNLRLVVKGGLDPACRLDAAPLERCKRLTADLDLDAMVVFEDQWCRLEERAAWYADADLAVVFGRNRLETRFASRTRVLDMAGHGLRVLTDHEDAAGRLLADYGLSIGCEPEPVAIADAVEAFANGDRPTPDVSRLQRHFHPDVCSAELRRRLRQGLAKRVKSTATIGSGTPIAPRVVEALRGLSAGSPQRVVLYGTGQGCRALIDSGLLDSVGIDALVDDDENQRGTAVRGHRVRAQALVELDAHTVVIATFRDFDPHADHPFLRRARQQGARVIHGYPFEDS